MKKQILVWGLLSFLFWPSPALLRAAEIAGSTAPDFSLVDLQRGQKCAACSVGFQKEREGVEEDLHGSSTHRLTSKEQSTSQEAPSQGSCH